ncbi:hypothetical protein [Thiorhodovibrio frisius]|uniref:Uncharacterized protein n=1 Tax=Thiorhodovibrio frisius TaxID=631362 RepID=H8Z8R1_9GAMM|nr:hypothetical protein [Thiorhodovibrio frisius]EIC19466.1 hypothetical protein Thi970DRAFT_04990 [Thiorhodovibrio frisius]WPL22228.1 hypothetical protein Thiofri_02388 [Thiorhodovibrio frisius]
MSIAAGEIGKQAVQETVSKTGGDAATRGGFDVPGERPGFDTQETIRGDAGRPGAGFDGPWDEKPTHSFSDTNQNSGFGGSWDSSDTSSTDIDKMKTESNGLETIEKENTKGGAYKDIPSREGHERHHIPADSVSDIARSDGPCVQMEKQDHHETASFGNSKDAREYRARQGELIQEGKFDQALQMDIDDIRTKFGSKYDQGIAQAQKYANQLQEQEV